MYNVFPGEITGGEILMVACGLDVILEDASRYRDARAAMVCNQTSVTKNFAYGWNALRAAGIRLKRVFSPEHGLFAVEQDQKPAAVATLEGIDVISLYGDNEHSLVPDAAALEGIDIVFMDIQDVGARYYTYLNTMAYFLKSVRGRDIECVVLDRPNPLGGLSSEGPGLESGFESFMGVFHVPVRHGLTAGELLLCYHKKQQLDCPLTVVPMKNWRRDMYYGDTKLPWVPPSPNMPTINTALVYPGLCLIEGTNLSEGRGTTTPFQIVGAPFIDKDVFADALNTMNLPGVYFRPINFRPTFNKYENEVCSGIFIHVLDPHAFLPFLTGIAIIKAAMELYGSLFAFAEGVYEFNNLQPAFDLLCGTDAIRKALAEGQSIEKIRGLWDGYEKEWNAQRSEWWLY